MPWCYFGCFVEVFSTLINSHACRPKAAEDDEAAPEEAVRTEKFKPDKGFKGADVSCWAAALLSDNLNISVNFRLPCRYFGGFNYVLQLVNCCPCPPLADIRT